MKRYALLFVLCVSSASSSFAQTKSPVEGVWKVTEWIEGGKINTSPQPALIIFTKGYYSVAMLMAPRDESTPLERGRTLTDAEKVAQFEQWKWFVGISGSYEVKESTVVMRPIVAKEPSDLNRQTTSPPEFKFEGPNTFWLILTTEKAKKVGLRMKLTRLE
jgi:hypothetical protein